jgi:oxygen-independent coproporphyrinogen-3 oxidase
MQSFIYKRFMYHAYTYAYPHKTAYRPFESPRPLQEVWAEERKNGLFLYIHIPFCEMRCGFCNLFTTVHPGATLESRYIKTLEQEAAQVQEAIGAATFARMAIGGGTPTYLEPHDLERVLAIAEGVFKIDLHQIPVSVETSPATATPERLALLRAHGVDRISIGVQSFREVEVHGVGRAQQRDEVEQALKTIRVHHFPTLNIDLIYGLPYQTESTWLESLRAALEYAPEELYLYPLYQRPLTGMDKITLSWDDHRLALYRAGRDFLLARGYTQCSMRMFRAAHAPMVDGPVYCCQEDGMVGLGCGARSYTRTTHYSSEYAVGQKGIRAILGDYLARPPTHFSAAHYGFVLDRNEQRRRYAIKSILHGDGLDRAAYYAYFGTHAYEDLPLLPELVMRGWATEENNIFSLTPSGFEWSDTIGPLLYSEPVNTLMAEYDLQ